MTEDEELEYRTDIGIEFSRKINKRILDDHPEMSSDQRAAMLVTLLAESCVGFLASRAASCKDFPKGEMAEDELFEITKETLDLIKLSIRGMILRIEKITRQGEEA